MESFITFDWEQIHYNSSPLAPGIGMCYGCLEIDYKYYNIIMEMLCLSAHVVSEWMSILALAF